MKDERRTQGTVRLALCWLHRDGISAAGNLLGGVMQGFKTFTGGIVVLAVIAGISYLEESSKYRFEKAAAAAIKQTPGARLISSFQSGDLASPLSWFRPTTTTWNFAMPDSQMGGRFYVVTMLYEDQDDPSVLLVDASCDDRSLTLYSLDAPEDSYPARDLFGGPVIAANGQTYRLIDPKAQLSDVFVTAFCDTDWSPERKAVAAAAGG